MHFIYSKLPHRAAGRDKIPIDVLAEQLTLAHGIDPNAMMQHRGTYGTDPGASVLQLLMRWTAKHVDTNQDGAVSYDEFRTAVRKAEAELVESTFFSEEALGVLGIDSFSDEALEAAFAAADLDGSGELNKEEVQQLLLKVNPALTGSDELKAMVGRVMKRLDTDNNERVSYQEFKAAWALCQLDQGWVKFGRAIFGI
eukprot:SAG31_NODE_10022_length_1194_cov_1.296804_1_plen_198_part_00